MAQDSSPANETTRVLHLTDPHLFADKSGELRGTVTWDSLSRVLDHYESSGWKAERVFVTGDIIQDDSAEAYRHFVEALSSLGLPVHCIPGNHDVRPVMRSHLSAAPFDYCAAIECGRWLVVGIDSCVDGYAGGRVSDEELERLDAAINRSDAEHVLVCLHHPPVEMGSAWLDTVGLDNRALLLSRLAQAGRVRAALFGHVHQVYDEEHGGIRILGTPSTCRQFLPMSEEFAVDNQPPAYRRIEMGADGSLSTEIVWIEDA